MRGPAGTDVRKRQRSNAFDTVRECQNESFLLVYICWLVVRKDLQVGVQRHHLPVWREVQVKTPPEQAAVGGSKDPWDNILRRPGSC